MQKEKKIKSHYKNFMLLEFNCRNIVFAQDQVSEYKAPDDLVSMSWDLLIPEGWQGSGLTGARDL